MAKKKRYRSAENGEFVSKEEAEENPSTTVSETVEEVVIDSKGNGDDLSAQELKEIQEGLRGSE